MTAKKCISCERPISGRSDKKFCDDSCRNNYNNRLNSDSTPVVRNINNILRKNRRILEELLLDREKKMLVIERKKLLEKGFHFEYFTQQIHLNRGKQYYYCYDYGYRSINNEKVVALKDSRRVRIRKPSNTLHNQQLVNS